MNLKYDEPLSNFALDLSLCHYSAGGVHRVVVDEELRGTSGRVLFNGRYVPTSTAPIPSDGGDATATRNDTITELTVTLPAPVDPSCPPVGCAWVQAVSDSGPTRRLPVGPSVPLLMVDDEEVAAEITAAAHVIRRSHSSGAYFANCFVRHLGNCIVPAACNLDDLAAAMEIVDTLDLSHTRQVLLFQFILLPSSSSSSSVYSSASSSSPSSSSSSSSSPSPSSSSSSSSSYLSACLHQHSP